jgi:capsular polysaccharide biosynthesis protein
VELRLLLAAVRRGALVLALALVVGVVLGFGVYKAMPRHYNASSTLLIDSGAILIPGQQPYTGDPERYISDQEAILTGQTVAAQVAAKVPGYDADEVRSALTLTHVTGSNTVTVTAKADSPKNAQLLANTVATAYLANRKGPAQAAINTQKAALQKELDDLSSRIAQLGNANSVQATQNALLTRYNALLTQMSALTAPGATEDSTAITDPATLPKVTTPSISLVEAVGGAGLVMLLLGFGFVLTREVRRPHVMTKAHAELIADREVVAAFTASTSSTRGRRSAGAARPASGSQRLASVIAAAPVAGPQRTITVTSAVDDVAASAVAKALAVDLLRQGSLVAVVDLMSGQPAARPVARNLTPAQGEAPSSESVDEFAMAGAAPGLARAGRGVPGALPAQPVRLPDNFQGVAHYRATAGMGIFSTDARDYAGALSSEFDVVIVQAPAVLQSGVAASFSRTADDTVLVVPLGRELEGDLRLADEMLRDGGTRMHLVTYAKH